MNIAKARLIKGLMDRVGMNTDDIDQFVADMIAEDGPEVTQEFALVADSLIDEVNEVLAFDEKIHVSVATEIENQLS